LSFSCVLHVVEENCFKLVLTILCCLAELAKLPILPPYLHPGRVEHVYGVNFASGGAGALRETSQGFVRLISP